MVTGEATFRIEPVSESELGELRARALSPSHVRLTASGGEPLRCCLRDASAGQSILLVNFRPDLPDSPYVEVGAIYVHAEPGDCVSVETPDYPAAWQSRRQVLRGYDDRGWIVATALHEPGEGEAAIEALFDTESVVQVHSRNVQHGCFMFRAVRSAPRDQA